MSAGRAPDAARGRRGLLALAALFFVPVAAAFWLYYGHAGWRTANEGELIDPPRPLPAIEFTDADGARTPGNLLRDRWTLLYIGDGRCDARCRDALYLTRQTRLALNKDSGRVRRVLIATAPGFVDPELGALHPDLVVAVASQEQLETLTRLIPALDGVALAEAGRIYVVDPLGNLMMSYSAAAPDDALLSDLKRLLRLSHIG